MAAVAVSELVRRARTWLNEDALEVVETGGVNTSATTLTFSTTDRENIAVGNVLEWDDGTGEKALVKAVPTTTTATVKRGHDGTTPATHAANAVMLKNPTWGFDVVKEAILRVVDADLWPHVWWFADTTITAASLQATPRPNYFNLNASDMAVISVMQPYDSNRRVHRYGVPGYPITFEQVPTAVAASGRALYIPSIKSNLSDITVRTARKVSSTTIEEGVIAETVVYGALARLLRSRDLRRHTQDNSQGQRSVQPGQSSRNATFWQREFESARLRANAEVSLLYPLARVWDR